MTLHSAPYYWITCDAQDCIEREPAVDDEITAWSDVDGAVETAKASDWLVTAENEHFCRDHANYICQNCGKLDPEDRPGDRDYLCRQCAADREESAQQTTS